MRKDNDDCPCHGCEDRNAYCHMKGHCPHGFEEWDAKNKAERDRINENKDKLRRTFTAAQEKRHFDYIKYGQGHTKR